MYTRILLKLSGEQLAGKYDSGIDAEFCAWLASEIKQVVDAGIEVVVMVGGGNYARGAQLAAANGITRVTADNIGMLATIMNALALSDIFNKEHVPTRPISSVFADQVIDSFSHRRAISHLSKGRVVIIGGGIGRPYLTTDTAAVSLALELNCKAVLKATKVDGVYDKDPAKHDDAKHLPKISYHQAVSDTNIKVMDKAAMGLAMEHSQPVVIFNAMQPGAILSAAKAETVGTLIAD